MTEEQANDLLDAARAAVEGYFSPDSAMELLMQCLKAAVEKAEVK